ncbi:MAG: U32 family peptidase, partial [Neofamilia sp.]
VVVDNLGGLVAFEDKKLIGDMGLNVFNSHGIDFLGDNNMEDIILSPELTFHQIAEIRRRTDATIETIGYGFLRVMTMKHCPFSLIKKCEYKRNCEVCNFKEGYVLRDEKNVDFKTKREDDLSIIYNSYPISIIEHLDKISESGIDYLLLDFTFEDNPQEIIDEFVKARNGKMSNLNEKLKEKWENITHGHYFRGVE